MKPVLWIVNHYAAMPDETSPGGTRHFSLARQLSRLGWTVHIIRSNARGTSVRRHVAVEDDVTVTSIAGTGHDTRGIARVAGWASFTASSQLRFATKGLPKPDVVLGSSVHIGAAWAARRLATRHNAAFVFEVRDLWPETLIAMGTLDRDSRPAKAMLALEGSLARSASLIVSPLPGVDAYMSDYHGIDPDRFVWISNGIDVKERSPFPLPDDERLRLQYLGAIGNANDVETILDAMRIAVGTFGIDCELQIIGGGSRREAMVELVRHDPVLARRVSFPPPVASKDVPKAMAWSNAVIIQVLDFPALYRFGISPNKVFEYLASGRWLIMGADVPMNPAAGAPGAIITKPTARDLADGIRSSAEMPRLERERRSWQNIEFAAEHYDFERLASRLSDRLLSLV